MKFSDDVLFAEAISIDIREEQEQFVTSLAEDESQEARVMSLVDSHHQLRSEPNVLLAENIDDFLEGVGPLANSY